ncbi:hypothetical protein D5086_030100 [Populus alba]|uniref:Uncharacterized protein n=1 Tax=Populus alba TaxID=43335 RepID=A0ACC4AMI3_POPAL
MSGGRVTNLPPFHHHQLQSTFSNSLSKSEHLQKLFWLPNKSKLFLSIHHQFFDNMHVPLTPPVHQQLHFTSRYHEDYSYTGSPDQDRRRSIGKATGHTSRQQSRSPSESYSSSPEPKIACGEEDISDRNITYGISETLHYAKMC